MDEQRTKQATDDQTPPTPDVRLKVTATEVAATEPVGMLELREEVVQISKERVQTGQVRFRREVQTRTETVTTELRRETLIIEVGPGEAEVFLGGERLQAGDVRELLLYDEQTVVSKVPYVTEEVKIGRQVITEQQQREIELKYEVLVVEESDTGQPGTGEPGEAAR